MIGDQLKRLRSERGLSLRALAREAGMSPTLLSQVERGVTDPSLATLRKLASVFGESVATLFDEPARAGVWTSRPGSRSVLIGPHGRVGYERLTPGNGHLEVLRAVLAPGQASSEEQWGHASLECAFVLSGILTVEIGSQKYPVRGGEAITFDSRQPHRYVNSSSSQAEYLVSVTPPIP